MVMSHKEYLLNKEFIRIFEKYHNKSNDKKKNIILCQKELIDASFVGNASW
jgi:hypothetical protein